MIEEGGAVGELVGAGQGGFADRAAERVRVVDLAAVQPVRDRLQRGFRRRPIVERRLQGRGDAGRRGAAFERIIDDHQPSVARSIPQGGELH